MASRGTATPSARRSARPCSCGCTGAAEPRSRRTGAPTGSTTTASPSAAGVTGATVAAALTALSERGAGFAIVGVPAVDLLGCNGRAAVPSRDTLVRDLEHARPELARHMRAVAALARGTAPGARACRASAWTNSWRGRAARRREGGGARRDPGQGRPADRRRGRVPAQPHGGGRAHPRHRGAAGRGGRARALQPRALGRVRLPGRAPRRGHPPGGAGHRRVRRLRDDGLRAPLLGRAGAGGGTGAQLRRTAERQFDPRVVEAFVVAHGRRGDTGEPRVPPWTA